MNIKSLFQRQKLPVLHVKKPPYQLILKKVLHNHNINLVIDVGARVGDFGKYLRCIGYKKLIISYEAYLQPYKILSSLSGNDGNWHCNHIALSNKNGYQKFYACSDNDNLSSFLKPESFLSKDHIFSKIRVKTITLRKCIETIEDEIKTNQKNIFLKIDTQGSELNILSNDLSILKKKVKVIQVEVSFSPLYKDEPLFISMLQLLESANFSIIAIEPVLIDNQSGQLVEADILAVNKSL